MKILLSMALCFPLLPAAKGEAPFWLQPTHDRTVNERCAVAHDKAELSRKLERLGWNQKRFPVIDWGSSFAVVIAPENSVKGWSLGFFGTLQEEEGLVVDWGWTRQQVNAADTADSVSYGKSSEGLETLVVAVDRKFEAAVQCRKVRK